MSYPRKFPFIPVLALIAMVPPACSDPIGTSDGSTTAEPETTTTATTSGDVPTTTAPTTSGPDMTTTVEPTSTGDTSTTGEDTPEPPDLHCPGDPSGQCEPAPDAKLEAGASVLSVIPDCFETWVDLDGDHKYKKGNDELHDCGCDRLCPEDPDYPGPDEGEGDGVLQAVWMAGFGSGRPAAGVRGAGIGLAGDDDGLWARTVVLRRGNTSVAIVALDVVGWFHGDVEAVRATLAEDGVDLDHLIVHATHNHEGPDTMGLWGPELFQSGYTPAYRAQLRAAVVTGVKAALADAREVAGMTIGEVDVSTYHPRGVANLIRDSRDPWVVDEFLSALRLRDADDQTIATLINFGNHPETLADKNLLITSDFVHALRRTVEIGSVWNSAPGRTGVGGPAIYLNGAVGGMMTTLGVEVENPDGDKYQSASWEKADSIGQLLGEMALDALEDGDEVADPDLRLINKVFRVPVDNTSFQFLFMQGTLEREVFPNPMTGKDEILTEMTWIELGPLQMLSIPGELLPELAVGGYDGSRINAPDVPLIKPTNPNPPQLELAPPGPYIKDRMGGTYRWLIGLGNDELGYIIPRYDFVLADTNPWVNEAEGNHYEETNAISADIADIVDEYTDLLLYWAQH